MGERSAFRWQGITLATLFVGYAGYYLCRSNLSVVTPLLLQDPTGSGPTREQIGAIASAGVLCYALGKFTNGILGDFLGGRRLFLLGMAASTVCTVLFGLSSGLPVLLVLWAVNRYVQSMGWGSLLKLVAVWFPLHRQASLMGVLSMSFLLGDALARLYLGLFISQGVGWRGVFLIAAATLGAITAISLFTLKARPGDLGLPEPAVNPENIFGADGNTLHPESLTSLLRPLLVNPIFWMVCAMKVGLTLIRETFHFWIPTYLTEQAGMDPGEAAQSSMLFPLVGAVAAVLAGSLSERLNRQHGRVAVPSLVLLTAALGVLAMVPVEGQPVRALLLLSAVAFFLLPPYSLCTGIIPLDLGGKRGSSTTAGLLDSASYLGAVFSGYGIGRIVQHYGWPAAFALLAGTAGLTLLAGILYWLRQERTLRTAAPPCP